MEFAKETSEILWLEFISTHAAIYSSWKFFFVFVRFIFFIQKGKETFGLFLCLDMLVFMLALVQLLLLDYKDRPLRKLELAKILVAWKIISDKSINK